MTYPGDMTDVNAARAMAARLRDFANSVRHVEHIDYGDDWGTGEGLAELLDKAAATIDELTGDEYDGPSELHPLTNGTVTIDLPDAVWATAEQMLDDGAALIVQAGGRTWVHHPGEAKQWGRDDTAGQ